MKASVKCDVSRCHAGCCYNVPMPKQLLSAFHKRIVNLVLYKEHLNGDMILPYTDNDVNKNKCPFLTERFKCNIYEYRPEICKKFGIGAHPLLHCSFLSDIGKEVLRGIENDIRSIYLRK